MALDKTLNGSKLSFLICEIKLDGKVPLCSNVLDFKLIEVRVLTDL